MAGWYNSGNWDGLELQELKNVFSDIAKAINEREDKMLITQTAFRYGDGTTTKVNPSAADYDGFPLGVANDGNNYHKLLVEQWRTAITGLLAGGIVTVGGIVISEFIRSGTDYTAMTSSYLYDTLGSYSTPDLSDEDEGFVTNYIIYEQIREALDNLRYVHWELRTPVTAGNADRDRGFGTGTYPADRATNAWNGLVDTSDTIATNIATWSVLNGGSVYTATIVPESGSATYNSSEISGDKIEVKIDVDFGVREENASWDSYVDYDIDFGGGDVETESPTADSTVTYTKTSWLNIGSDTDVPSIEITTTVPGSPPFTADDPTGSGGINLVQQGYVGYVQAYTDLDTVLTYY